VSLLQLHHTLSQPDPTTLTILRPLSLPCRGWSLPTYSYYIDQTIAGAVATGTHGSSTAYGSISNLLV
jgi:FAD/FMN-containing dehydrogenase